MSGNKSRPGPSLRGTITALVTPFEGAEVDWKRLGATIDRQLAAGVDALAPAGTTGEVPTLSPEEHEKLIHFVVEKVDRRVPVLAGVGKNSTAGTIRLARIANEAGVDAGLVVVPYYNRPTPQGVVEHYRAVYEESGLPICVYNVPSRTGYGLTADVYDRLAGIQGIFAVKEASGDLNLVSHLIANHDLVVLAGDDALTVPIMSIGGAGVISVASNVVPAEMKLMTDACLMDDWTQARNIHKRLYPLFRGLFLETNPIPVKCALRMLALDSGILRLPLVGASSRTEEVLNGVLQALGMLGSELDGYIDPRD